MERNAQQKQQTNIKDSPLLLAHWSAWCCQSVCVAQYILSITMTVTEVVGTENWVTSNLPFLFKPSSIAKMQS